MFNLAIALGALFGSIAAGAMAISAVLWLAAIVVILTCSAMLRAHVP